MTDPLRQQLVARLGAPMGSAGPAIAPDAVNVAMIRHWVDALDDRNPIYSDEAYAAGHRFGGVVAPPAMLQTWTMGRPQIAGIAERGGAPGDIDPASPLAVLAGAGFTATLATNSELEFERYLRVGEQVQATTTLEAISELKSTALGSGYFVTWLTRYVDGDGAAVGRQRFTVYRFAPGTAVVRSGGSRPRAETAPPAGEVLPEFDLDVTATVIVAGAIASRDFMPVHHDRDFAIAQGAPDIFMNILTSNGYVSRYVTDWAGPDATVRRIAIRLGAPALPGQVLRFRGQVNGETVADADRTVDVAVRADSELGNHLAGSVVITLPRTTP